VSTAKDAAKKALLALGKEDLLYAHHGVVHARPKAYDRLGELFEEYARQVQGCKGLCAENKEK